SQDLWSPPLGARSSRRLIISGSAATRIHPRVAPARWGAIARPAPPRFSSCRGRDDPGGLVAAAVLRLRQDSRILRKGTRGEARAAAEQGWNRAAGQNGP